MAWNGADEIETRALNKQPPRIAVQFSNFELQVQIEYSNPKGSLVLLWGDTSPT